MFDKPISGWHNKDARSHALLGRQAAQARGHDTRGRMAACLEPMETPAANLPGTSPPPVRERVGSAPDAKLALQDDRHLVPRLQAGDRQAFEQLLERYEARVYRLALRFTGAVTDAEDVTQDVFLGVYKSIGNFRGGAALGTWIYRIAMNHCLEFRRKRKLDSIPYDEELTLASHDWREDPEQSANKSELSARVEAALQCLSPQHRDVIILHELQGLTYQEVASALDVPVGTVKSRLSNAFRKLRDLLGNYVHETG